MVKIIEASAVISARAGDMSGLDKVAANLLKVSKAGQAVKTQFGGAAADMGKRIEEINSKLSKIDNFRTMSRGLDQASTAMKVAQQRARDLKTALDAAERPTRGMQDEYARAAMAVDRATRAFREQGQAVRASRSALEQAGVPVNSIARQQQQLTSALNTTTAAMHRQAQAARAMASPWGARPGARVSGSGVPLIPLGVLGSTPRVAASTGGHRIGGIGAIGTGIGGVWAGRSAYDRALEFERSVNASIARGELTPEQAAELRRNARTQGAAGRGFSAKDVSELQRAFVQAGAEKQAAALADTTMNFARFGDVDPFEAADVSVSGVSAFGIMPGDPRFPAAVRRYQDVIAKGANISRLNVGDLAAGFKFAGPIAHRLGITQEQLAAMIVTQGQAGLRGDEAGVAVRSALVRAIRPTADARQVMAEMGMRFEDYQSGRKDVDFANYASGLRAQGFNIAAKRDVIEARANAAVEAGGDQATALSEAVMAEMGVKRVIDQRKIAKMTAKYVSSLGEGLDINRLLDDLQKRGVTAGQIARIFDAKQGARLSTLIGPDYERYRKVLETESDGASARGAAALNQGAVGAHNRLISSYDNLILTMAESGVLDTAAKGLDGVASGLRSLAEASPRLIEIGTYGVIAAAALGPLSFAVTRLAGAAGAVGSAVGAGTAAAGAAGMAGTTLPRFFGWAGLAYGGYQLLDYAIGQSNRELYKDVAPGEVHNEGRNRRKRFNTMLHRETQQLRESMEPRYIGPGIISGGAASFGFGPGGSNLELTPRGMSVANVNVSGSAVLELAPLRVEPSSELIRVVNEAKRVTATVPLTSSNGPGSLGTSMPGTEAPNFRYGGGGGGGGAM